MTKLSKREDKLIKKICILMQTTRSIAGWVKGGKTTQNENIQPYLKHKSWDSEMVCLSDAGRAYAIERGWLAAEAAPVEPVLDYGVTEHYPIVSPQPAAALPALPDSQFVDSGTHVAIDSELIDKNEIALGNWQATNDYARKLESELQAARAEIARLKAEIETRNDVGWKIKPLASRIANSLVPDTAAHRRAREIIDMCDVFANLEGV